jgi:predicted nucleotidyltransferase
MRTDLDHLPRHKQRELERVVQLIFEEFADALSLSTHQRKKQGRIQKVILYGSYARGGWIDEPHTAKGYKSDYDLLIIVNDKRLTDRVEYWAKLGAYHLQRAHRRAQCQRTAGGIVAHR